MKLTAIVLAAGSSRRMGTDKIALTVHGERVLYRALSSLVCSARINKVVLVVQPGFSWPDGPVACRIVTNPDFEQGMGSSLAAGVRAADADTEAYLIALGDMPNLSMLTLNRLIDAFSNSSRGIVRPFYQGHAGHPVIIDRAYREQLLAITGDVGAREVLKDHRNDVYELLLDDPAIVHDIDRPEDIVARTLARNVKVLVKGAGEMASGVAHQLFTCGFQVMMTDLERPTTIRRAVAFSSAVQHGEVEVEGVQARAFDLQHTAAATDFSGRYIPVFVDPRCELAERWRPDVIIDARLLKRQTDTKITDAPLVIGLGPGFTAGADVHLVVETNRGHDLARLIRHGQAQANTSTPGMIKGHSKTRILRSPATGIFDAEREIGDQVEAGDVVGRIRGQALRTSISGVLRGLIHPRYEVGEGQKIGDVDPRGDASYCSTISEKARNIGGACLLAVMQNTR
ncbi:MAG: EF2563 family selenium-dependent molybdenum hydroxylase system protein [Thermoanaerobaculales bacterium]|nr:EF2563 family selenium-dependent molybdenum hydroxylase system protein [Thermoanaerobaculales bacterium]